MLIPESFLWKIKLNPFPPVTPSMLVLSWLEWNIYIIIPEKAETCVKAIYTALYFSWVGMGPEGELACPFDPSTTTHPRPLQGKKKTFSAPKTLHRMYRDLKF